MTPADAIDDAATSHPRAASSTSRASWKEAALLGAFYVLMHGGILLIPNAVYWDDWVLYRTAPETIARMFRDAGAMFDAVTHLHAALLGLGLWSYKLLTFVLWFASGLLLNRILARTQLLPAGARLAVVLLFLVLPFNAARVAAINFPYTLTCFFFFAAWDLMDRRRLAALLLFAASFFTPSLLTFYALPMLDMLYRGGHLSSTKAFGNFVLRRLHFLLLPFVFFGARLLTFNPSGTYTGYQSNYSLENVRNALNVQWFDLLDMPLRFDVLLFLPLLPLTWLLLTRSPWPKLAGESAGLVRLLAWMVLGVLAFVLGGFPYWVLQLWPVFTEWTSRHQLLLPLGTALVLVAVLWTLPVRLRMAGLSVLLAICLSFGLGTYYAFWVDWQKQRTLVELFKRDPEIAMASMIVFVDGTSYLNAIGRHYRFYEWNGLLEEAFGTETRFGVSPLQAKSYVRGSYDAYMQGQYKASGHRRDPAAGALLVEISAVSGSTSGPGFGIWRWPPLPAIELKTRQLAPDAPLLTGRN
jgi:hypothetical protein